MRLRVIFIASTILCVVICIIMINYNQGMKYEVPKIKFPELAGGNDYEFDIDNNAVQKICNKFNINNQTKKSFDNQITYGTDNILTVYDNGCLDFYTIEGTPLCNVSVSDEECKGLANGIINELGIFPEGSTKLIIDDVKISYWEDSTVENGNNTIQPVYEYTGKAYDNQNELGEFTILESVMR